MKKKLLLLAVAMAVLALGIGSTISYFNSKDTADNVFTVGDVKISLTEDKWNPDDDHLIQDNKSYDKNPVVTNTGKNPAYVRIHVKLSDYNGIKAVLNDADPETLFDIKSGSWEAASDNPKIEGSTATYTYFYKEILNPNVSTQELFTKVSFTDGLNQDALTALSETFEISIYADAVQSEGFSDIEEAFAAFDNKN